MVLNFGDKLMEGRPDEVMTYPDVKGSLFRIRKVAEVIQLCLKPTEPDGLLRKHAGLEQYQLPVRRKSDRRCVRGQQRREVDPDVHAFRDYAGYSEKRSNGRWGTNHHLRTIRYIHSVDIMGLKPSIRAKVGIILCPERRRIFHESTVLENLKIGGYLATYAQAKDDPRLCAWCISCT